MGVRAVCTKTCPGRAATDRAVESTRVLTSGANPRTGFVKVSLTQCLRRLYCAGSDGKYDEAKQVERGDPLRYVLVPPVSEETDHSGVTENVSQADMVLRRVSGGQQKGETTKSDTAAARPSGPADKRPSLFVSPLLVTRRRSSAVRADSGRAAS